MKQRVKYKKNNKWLDDVHGIIDKWLDDVYDNNKELIDQALSTVYSYNLSNREVLKNLVYLYMADEGLSPFDALYNALNIAGAAGFLVGVDELILNAAEELYQDYQ